MIPSTERGGYVLVLTLAVIALAAISLAGLARFSLGLAAGAQESVEELQHRWGLNSVRGLLLDQAAAILDVQIPGREASAPPWPKPSEVSLEFNLGSHKFTVLMADENAKADLNTIYRRQPKKVHAAIRRLTRSVGTSAPSVALVPQRGMRRAFTSWGQVFDWSRSGSSARVAPQLVAASRDMTLWSGEQLNLRRASDVAVREIASLALSAKEVSELVALRKHWGGEDIDHLLGQLELRASERAAAKRLLGTDSNRFSLWVLVDNGLRTWSYQYVTGAGPVSFAW